MLDIFKGREEIANATNKLFETGFYLLNLNTPEKSSNYIRFIKS